MTSLLSDGRQLGLKLRMIPDFHFLPCTTGSSSCEFDFASNAQYWFVEFSRLSVGLLAGKVCDSLFPVVA